MKSVALQKISHRISAELDFPGDKSLTHRAIIFGSLAEGVSSFTNVLPAEDCLCTRKAFESMGVEISSERATQLKIVGGGLHALRKPKREIYLGNSGTAMRLLLGVLAGQSFEATLTGDASLSSRPMRRLTDYLRQMGARIDGRDNANFAPLRIQGGPLKGIDARLPVASAQVKSAVLLAGLYADGLTRVTEPVKSRDHTERFLSFFGAGPSQEGLSVAVRKTQALKGRSFEIAGDISSAAFFMAMAALLPGADIGFRSVLWNPTRSGIITVLKRMGVEVNVRAVRDDGPESAADFSLSAGDLKAFQIKKEELPALIDELPILAVLATQASGTSLIHEAAELRVKETDRIHSMVTGLSKMGARIKAQGDTLRIEGPTPLRGAQVDSFKDHRTAMSLVVAGLLAEGQTLVRDVECIDTSFPGFFSHLKRLGAAFQLLTP